MMTLFLFAPALLLAQLEAPIYERLLDQGMLGLLVIVGWTLFFRSEKKREDERKEHVALQGKLEAQAKEYAADLRVLVVNANTGNDRTADALEATGKSLDVIAVEFRRNNDSRGLPRAG